MSYRIEQFISTMIGGYIGGLLPNDKSNSPRLLTAIILGSLVSKIIYGDFDDGYKWTISDIWFWIITIFFSLVGGAIAMTVKHTVDI